MKIGYARVSARQQNLDMQLEAFRKEGCEKIYQEKKTAFKERPELTQALDDLRAGDTLYVWALDRLGRTMFEVLDNIKKIHDRGASLSAMVQNIDTSMPTGKILIPIFSILTELEIELKRERVAESIRLAREQGRRLGRPAGISDEAKKTAQTAYKMYHSKDPTYPVRKICETLNMSLRTFYKYIKIIEQQKNEQHVRKKIHIENQRRRIKNVIRTESFDK
ncbi:MAG: recombinase family protein [Tannerella sp.]|jgi:DNA invertase Pin-like site-specific DNA recombinase|nr:recombinase family protein [Tannerella sp.]